MLMMITTTAMMIMMMIIIIIVVVVIIIRIINWASEDSLVVLATHHHHFPTWIICQPDSISLKETPSKSQPSLTFILIELPPLQVPNDPGDLRVSQVGQSFSHFDFQLDKFWFPALQFDKFWFPACQSTSSLCPSIVGRSASTSLFLADGEKEKRWEPIRP